MAEWKTPKTDWVTNPKNPVAEDFNRIEGNIEFLKEDIETKKGFIVSAINDMGQSADITDTHAQLAAKIKAISSDANADVSDVLKGKTFYAGGQKRTGTLELTGDATAAQVLSGYTFYNTNPKSKLTGAMPNRGAMVITPSVNNQAIPAGYHNGSGYVQGDANLISSNIAYGKTIFGVTGTFRGNMVKSIQTGQVSFSPGSGSSSNVTISSVNVNSSIVLAEYLGWSQTSVASNYFYGVEISASDRLTFYYLVSSGAPNLELQWKVIEFYPEAVRSLQKGVASSSTSSVSINPVTRSKSLVIVTGGFRIGTPVDQTIFRSRAGYLSNSSTLILIGYGYGDCRWQVIEFY